MLLLVFDTSIWLYLLFWPFLSSNPPKLYVIYLFFHQKNKKTPQILFPLSFLKVLLIKPLPPPFSLFQSISFFIHFLSFSLFSRFCWIIDSSFLSLTLFYFLFALDHLSNRTTSNVSFFIYIYIYIMYKN